MGKFFSLLFISICWLPGFSMAKTTHNSVEWQKSKPVFKQEFDWLKLTSDEWLKGDIISMYDVR